MAKKVVVVLAEGFEEIEAITPIDILRRAGLEVTVAGLGARDVAGAHGLKVQADVILEQYHDMPDAIVLPGGLPGAENLANSKVLENLIRKMDQAGKLIGAICAAPSLVLARKGFLENRKATCYPGFEKNFGGKTTFLPDRVVRDGNVTTSRGPGSAIEFALELVGQLAGPEKAEKLAGAMLAKV